MKNPKKFGRKPRVFLSNMKNVLNKHLLVSKKLKLV